jgi:hypothetical protein
MKVNLKNKVKLFMFCIALLSIETTSCNNKSEEVNSKTDDVSGLTSSVNSNEGNADDSADDNSIGEETPLKCYYEHGHAFSRLGLYEITDDMRICYTNMQTGSFEYIGDEAALCNPFGLTVDNNYIFYYGWRDDAEGLCIYREDLDGNNPELIASLNEISEENTILKSAVSDEAYVVICYQLTNDKDSNDYNDINDAGIIILDKSDCSVRLQSIEDAYDIQKPVLGDDRLTFQRTCYQIVENTTSLDVCVFDFKTNEVNQKADYTSSDVLVSDGEIYYTDESNEENHYMFSLSFDNNDNMSWDINKDLLGEYYYPKAIIDDKIIIARYLKSQDSYMWKYIDASTGDVYDLGIDNLKICFNDGTYLYGYTQEGELFQRSIDMLCAYDITMGGLYEDVSSNTTMYDESTVVLGILCYAYMGDSYYQDMTDELNEYLELLNCDYKIAIKGISITAWEDSGLSFAEYCEKYYSDVDILQVVSFSENNNVTYDILEEDIYLKLDDYLETEQGKELYLTIPENKWAEVKVNGNIYSVPNTYFDDSGVYFAFNPDYIDAKDLEKFDGTLAGIKDILNNTNVQGLDDTVLLYSGTDILNIYGGHLRYGLYFDDITGEISIWSSSSKIKKVFEELNELNDLGYISNSATMSSTISSDDGDYPTILEDALKSGEYAVCIGYGRDISDYLENAIIYRCDSYTYNKLGYSMGIYSQTDNESAACDFLNKMYCDETLVNLLNYGAAYSIDTKTFSGDTSNLERDSMINGLNFGNWLFAQDSNSDDKEYRRKFYDELSGSIKNGKFLGFEIDTTGYKSIIDTLNDSCLDNIDLWKSGNFEEEWEKISKENESEEALNYLNDISTQVLKYINESEE